MNKNYIKKKNQNNQIPVQTHESNGFFLLILDEMIDFGRHLILLKIN